MLKSMVGCRNNSETDELNKEKELLVEENHRQTALVSKLRCENKKLQKESDNKDLEIEKKNEEIVDLNSQISECNEKIANLESQLRRREDQQGNLVGLIIKTLKQFDLVIKTPDILDESFVKKATYELSNMLTLLDVNEIDMSEGEFNPKFQRIVSVVKTDKEDLDNKISSSVRKGYSYKGECILPQDIEIYSRIIEK